MNRLLRSIVVCLLTCGSVLGPIACGGPRRDANEISVALFQAPASQALLELVPEFERASGIRVRVEVLPYADLKTRVEQQFLAGTKVYDVVMADCIWIPSFASRNYLGQVDTSVVDASDYGFDDLLPALDDYLGRYPRGGPRYGVPFMSNVHMMAYRRALVAPVAAQLGVPLPGTRLDSAWTWAQYATVASAITRRGAAARPRFYGTSLQARAGAWLVYEWYSVLFGFVADTAARVTGLPPFDSTAAAAMDFYASLFRVAPPAALTWGHEEETSAMCSGLTAMDATSNVELAAGLLVPQCGSPGAIAFAFPPAGASGRPSPDMGGYGLLLSSRAPRQSASRFVLWAASRDVHRRIVLGGGSPIRASETRDPTVLERYPYLSFYEALIGDAVYRARVPEWLELQDILSRELTSVMTGRQRARAAAANVSDWVAAHVH